MKYIFLLLIAFNIKALALSSNYDSKGARFQNNKNLMVSSQLTQGREFSSYDDLYHSRQRMSQTKYVFSVILSVVPGLGVGHIVQSRWLSRGWMFTVSEIAAVYLAVLPFFLHELDLLDPSDPDLQIPLLIISWGFRAIFLGAKVWEIYDVVTYNNRSQRDRYSQIKSNTNIKTQSSSSSNNQNFSVNVPVFRFSF